MARDYKRLSVSEFDFAYPIFCLSVYKGLSHRIWIYDILLYYMCIQYWRSTYESVTVTLIISTDQTTIRDVVVTVPAYFNQAQRNVLLQ